MEEFLVGDGDNVKITVSMKGREMMFKGQAEEMLKRFIADMGEKASVMIPPKLGGETRGSVLFSISSTLAFLGIFEQRRAPLDPSLSQSLCFRSTLFRV